MITKKKAIFLVSIVFVLLIAVNGVASAGEWPAVSDVDPDRIWTIEFNSPVNPDTVQYINVFNFSTLSSCDYSVSLSDEQTVKVYPPAEGYIPGNTYRLIIPDIVQSTSGKNLQDDIYMGFTIKESTNSSGAQEFDVIYEDFSQPLSENWDLANSPDDDWVVDPDKGAYCNGSELGFLIFDLDNYVIPDNYTIECELCCCDSFYNTGVFFKGNEELKGDSSWYYWPPRVWLTPSHLRSDGPDMESIYKNAEIEEERYYTLKVVVKGRFVDIYLDNIYSYSTSLSEEEANGKLIGIMGDDFGGYIKSFKITNNDRDNSEEDDSETAELQEFTVLYDDFTQPLSEKWDISSHHGVWSIDPDKGAYTEGTSLARTGLLTYNLDDYIIPDNYTIECEFYHEHGMGVFFKGDEELKGEQSWSHWPPRVQAMNIYIWAEGPTEDIEFESVQERLETGRYYTLKVVVRGINMDVYVDGAYKFSTTLTEKGLNGKLIGMVGENNGGYIKSFKIINNDNYESSGFSETPSGTTYNSLFDINSIQYDENNVPVVNIQNESFIIDSFRAELSFGYDSYGNYVSGYNIGMNVFNVIPAYILYGANGVLEIRNESNCLDGIPVLIPGWGQTPSFFGRFVDSIGKLSGAFSDPYNWLDSRDAMNSNLREIENLFVPSGYTIVISKNDEWAYAYNAYTIMWDLLDLADSSDIELDQRTFSIFCDILLADAPKDLIQQFLEQENYLKVGEIFVSAGLSALSQKVDTVIYKQLRDRLAESAVLSGATGPINFAENFVLCGNIVDQMVDLHKNMFDEDYIDNTIILQIPITENTED